MNVFLNERSFCGQAINMENANQLIRNVMEVIRVLQELSATKIIYTSQRLWEQKLSIMYSVYDYINSGDKYIDFKRLFQLLVTKGPYIETAFAEELSGLNCWLEVDSSRENVAYTSIGAALVTEGILTSLENAPCFDVESLSLNYIGGNNEIIKSNVPNFFDIKRARLFMKEFIKDKVVDWRCFWEQRHVLFPELIFCEEVKVQLQSIRFTSADSIFRHLKCMNDYIADVRSDKVKIPNYTKMGVEASTESDITLLHFSNERTFICPDGNKRVFTWHSKLKGVNLRIHFYPPSKDNQHFIIGYIGRHRSTWSDQT